MSVEKYREYRNKTYRNELPFVVKEFWDTKPSEKQEDLSYRRSVRSCLMGIGYTLLASIFFIALIWDMLD